MCAQCPFEPACKKCNGKHHTLLHDDTHNVMMIQTEFDEPSQSFEEEMDVLSTMYTENFYHVKDGNATILATALVPVVGTAGPLYSEL